MTSLVTSEIIKSKTIKEELENLGLQFPPAEMESNEPNLESDLHRKQIDLLIDLLEWHWRDRQDFYASGNLTIYYSPNQLKSEYFRGPDFFVVLDTEKRDRKSWIVWHEDGKYPNVIVEILSKNTGSVDRGLKKEIYQNTFRTPDYFWFDPETLEFKGFYLNTGGYIEIEPTEEGWLWSKQLNLYLGIYQKKLRFFTQSKELVLLPEEQLTQELEQERLRTEQESLRAEQESRRADLAQQEIDRLKALLKQQGMDIEDK